MDKNSKIIKPAVALVDDNLFIITLDSKNRPLEYSIPFNVLRLQLSNISRNAGLHFNSFYKAIERGSAKKETLNSIIKVLRSQYRTLLKCHTIKTRESIIIDNKQLQGIDTIN